MRRGWHDSGEERLCLEDLVKLPPIWTCQKVDMLGFLWLNAHLGLPLLMGSDTDFSPPLGVALYIGNINWML